MLKVGQKIKSKKTLKVLECTSIKYAEESIFDFKNEDHETIQILEKKLNKMLKESWKKL